MSREIQLDIIAPTGPIFSETIEFLSIMGPEGSLGILPGHLPVFMLIDVGYIEYQNNGQRDFVTTMGGILEYHHNHATVLTEAAEHAADIDELRAKQAAERASMQMTKQAGTKVLEEADHLAALQRARTRLRVVELLKNRHTRRRI